MKRKEKDNEFLQWIIIIGIFILLVIAVILYYGSFGNIDFTNDIEKKLIKHNKWIDHRIRKLEKLYSDKVDLKKRLDESVRKIFFGFRIISTIVFITINILTFIFCGAEGFFNKLGCVMNLNEALFLVFVLGSFLFTNKLSDISFLIRIIHLKIKKIVYGKFKTLDSDVTKIKEEIIELNNKKQENLKQLQKMQTNKNDIDDLFKNDSSNPPIYPDVMDKTIMEKTSKSSESYLKEKI